MKFCNILRIVILSFSLILVIRLWIQDKPEPDANVVPLKVRDGECKRQDLQECTCFEVLETRGWHHLLGPRDIKKYFRKASKIYHPDKGGDDADFVQVMKCHDKLSEPDFLPQYVRAVEILQLRRKMERWDDETFRRAIAELNHAALRDMPLPREQPYDDDHGRHSHYRRRPMQGNETTRKRNSREETWQQSSPEEEEEKQKEEDVWRFLEWFALFLLSSLVYLFSLHEVCKDGWFWTS